MRQTFDVNISVVVLGMEKNMFRAVVKQFFFFNLTAKYIKAELDEVHRDSAPALKTISFWIH